MGTILSRRAPVLETRAAQLERGQRAMEDLKRLLRKHAAISAFELLRDALKQTPEGRALLNRAIANASKGPKREMSHADIANICPLPLSEFTEVVEEVVDAGVGVGLIQDAYEPRYTTTDKCEAALKPFKSKKPDARPFRSSSK